MNNYNLQEQPQSGGYVYQDASLLSSLIQRIFMWMAMGLAITGLTSYLTFESNLFYMMLSQGRAVFLGLILAELGIVWFLSSRIYSLSFSTATVLFALYSILNGVSLSYIFALYTMESLTTTFFITAGTFGATALFGYVTKRDLSKMGSILMMGLIGLIIAGLVNIFLQSSTVSLIASCAGVLIFTGLTAWDIQRFKAYFSEVYEDSEEVKKLSLLGALELYLDFINLFIYLLRIFGSRRN